MTEFIPPSAIIIAFVPRRKKPEIRIAIRCDFFIGLAGDVAQQPANANDVPDGA